MNVNSKPFVPRHHSIMPFTPLTTLDYDTALYHPLLPIIPSVVESFQQLPFQQLPAWIPSYGVEQQEHTYLPLPLGEFEPEMKMENDASWTPLWSDLFQVAEQERERREFEEHEENENSRRRWNTWICSERKLIHVAPAPAREVYCNVKEIERLARQVSLRN